MKTVINKKAILLAISFALVLSLSVGTAFAYFSDYATAKGGAAITLGGKTDINEDVNGKIKTISIENTGETDVVVRVKIFGQTDIKEVGDGWSLESDGFWYYDKVLKPTGSDKTTTNIVAEVVAPAGQVDNYDVVVVHESAQVTYGTDGKIKVPTGWVNVIN